MSEYKLLHLSSDWRIRVKTPFFLAITHVAQLRTTLVTESGRLNQRCVTTMVGGYKRMRRRHNWHIPPDLASAGDRALREAERRHPTKLTGARRKLGYISSKSTLDSSTKSCLISSVCNHCVCFFNAAIYLETHYVISENNQICLSSTQDLPRCHEVDMPVDRDFSHGLQLGCVWRTAGSPRWARRGRIDYRRHHPTESGGSASPLDAEENAEEWRRQSRCVKNRFVPSVRHRQTKMLEIGCYFFFFDKWI